MIDYRIASLDDVPLLARMNRQLVEDEQHRNRFRSDAWLEERMRAFLGEGYTAVIFQLEGEAVAYALYRDHPDHEDTLYLRQIFVHRQRRRQGIGRTVVHILRDQVWPTDKRITVEVLVGNQVAREFYKAVGFQPYCLELDMPPGTASV